MPAISELCVELYGYIGTREAPEICLAGLRRLEYRGYDSAGIAVVNGKNIDQRKVVGKLDNLAEALAGNGISDTETMARAAASILGSNRLEDAHRRSSF